MACIDCTHYVPTEHKPIKITEDNFIYFDTVEVKSHCGLGNIVEWDEWWASAVGIPADEARLNVPHCFEETRLFVTLNNMIKLLTEIDTVLTNQPKL